MGVTWVAVAAIVLSALTFIASQRELGRRGRATYLAELEKKVAELERRIETCEADRQELHEENFRLMRRVTRLEENRP